MTTTQGRGGGGHGGGHGGHGHHDGFGSVYYDPWVFYDVSPEGSDCEDHHKRHVIGGEGLSTGTGALVVMAAVWLLYEMANKRASR